MPRGACVAEEKRSEETLLMVFGGRPGSNRPDLKEIARATAIEAATESARSSSLIRARRGS